VARKSRADAPSVVDVRLRLIAVALEPALALARVSAVPLDDLQAMVTVGYFRELRARGLTLRGIARRMHKSLRTVAGISQLAAREQGSVGGSDRLRRRRKLVAYLGKHPRASFAQLQRLLPKASRAAVEEELKQLAAQGIVKLGERSAELSAEIMTLVSDQLEPRIDSLRHFLGSVTQVIYRRFWTTDPEREAFARVLSFRVDAEEFERLRSTYYEALRNAAIKADGRAGADALDVSAAVCFVRSSAALPWAPGD
jgi:hypothetical protein